MKRDFLSTLESMHGFVEEKNNRGAKSRLMAISTIRLMVDVGYVDELFDHELGDVEVSAPVVPTAETIAELSDPSPKSFPLFEDPDPIPVRMRYDEYKVLVGEVCTSDRHVSASALSTWQGCPAQWVMDKAGIAVEQPSIWNCGGRAVHAALDNESDFEEEFKAEIDLVTSDTGIPVEDFRVAGRGKEGYDFWLVKGPDMVENGRRMLREAVRDGWAPTATEERLETTLYGGRTLVAIPDMVLTRGPETLIVDYKTGASMPTGCQQLLVYALSLVSTDPTRQPIFGEFWNLRKGETARRWNLCDDNIDMASDALLAFSTSIENLSMAPAPSRNCYMCAHSKTCPAL